MGTTSAETCSLSLLFALGSVARGLDDEVEPSFYAMDSARPTVMAYNIPDDI
jgi:hypothetical protein